MVLEANCVGAGLVYRDFEDQIAEFGDTVNAHLPAKFTIAAIQLGNKLSFGKECLKYLWANEKDISDKKVLEEICNNLQLNFNEVEALVNSEKVEKIYSENSNNAIKENVFGAPTYIYEDELYWGQDRLDYLEDKIK